MSDLDWKPRDGREPRWLEGSQMSPKAELEDRRPVEPLVTVQQPTAVPADDGDAAAVRDLNAGLAREAHARNAAFEKARDDAAAAKARHEAEVAAIASRNAARAAEHARQVADAEAAQRAYQEAIKPKAKPTPQCTTRRYTSTLSDSSLTHAGASSALASQISRLKSGGSVTSVSAGAPICAQRILPYIKPPPIGTCLSCITEKLAIGIYGYVPGKGYPPPPTDWRCTVTAQIAAQKCGTGEASKVSNQ